MCRLSSFSRRFVLTVHCSLMPLFFCCELTELTPLTLAMPSCHLRLHFNFFLSFLVDTTIFLISSSWCRQQSSRRLHKFAHFHATTRDHPFRKFHSIWAGNSYFHWILPSFVFLGISFLMSSRHEFCSSPFVNSHRVKCNKFHLISYYLHTLHPPISKIPSDASLVFFKQTPGRRDNTTIYNQIFHGHFLSSLSFVVVITSHCHHSDVVDGVEYLNEWMSEWMRTTMQR